jgi:NIMA (never in mitosis gene a)-related kinase
MHEKRIMHRDLKPANIFIAANGALKLGDLGLGRDFSSQTIEAYSRVGTPLYMSPEVLKGNGYDWKSDCWSLGCVVYELACLRSPFKSDEKISLYELFNNINRGEFTPLPSKYSEELQ